MKLSFTICIGILSAFDYMFLHHFCWMSPASWTGRIIKVFTVWHIPSSQRQEHKDTLYIWPTLFLNGLCLLWQNWLTFWKRSRGGSMFIHVPVARRTT